MKQRRLRTLDSLQRVARVRELEARVALSEAVQREKVQSEMEQAARGRLDSAEQQLAKLSSGERMQLGRRRLDQELATTLAGAWDDARSELDDCSEASEQRSSELALCRQRSEHLSEKASDTRLAYALAVELGAATAALEDWLSVQQRNGER